MNFKDPYLYIQILILIFLMVFVYAALDLKRGCDQMVAQCENCTQRSKLPVINISV